MEKALASFYGEQRVLVGDGPTVPRIEPFSPSVWSDLPLHVRVTLIVLIILAFAIPICVGAGVSEQCQTDRRCCSTESGFSYFVENWSGVYLRIGFVLARLTAIIVIHYWHFPTEDSYQRAESGARGTRGGKEEEGERATEGKEDPWWAIFVPTNQRGHPIAREAWLKSTMYFGFVSLYLFAHLILNWMWHAMSGCAHDSESARTILLYTLGTSIALIPLLAEADVYSAAAIGVYVASIIYTLIVSSASSDSHAVRDAAEVVRVVAGAEGAAEASGEGGVDGDARPDGGATLNRPA
jgi:hypothetical protein